MRPGRLVSALEREVFRGQAKTTTRGAARRVGPEKDDESRECGQPAKVVAPPWRRPSARPALKLDLACGGSVSGGQKRIQPCRLGGSLAHSLARWLSGRSTRRPAVSAATCLAASSWSSGLSWRCLASGLLSSDRLFVYENERQPFRVVSWAFVGYEYKISSFE